MVIVKMIIISSLDYKNILHKKKVNIKEHNKNHKKFYQN